MVSIISHESKIFHTWFAHVAVVLLFFCRFHSQSFGTIQYRNVFSPGSYFDNNIREAKLPHIATSMDEFLGRRTYILTWWCFRWSQSWNHGMRKLRICLALCKFRRFSLLIFFYKTKPPRANPWAVSFLELTLSVGLDPNWSLKSLESIPIPKCQGPAQQPL
jgi:hypothetical protein